MKTSMKKTARALIAAAMLVTLMASPALADQPRVESEQVIFTDLNPCTGSDNEITIDFTIKIHEHRNNFLLVIDSTVVTDDGFEGTGHETFVDNGNIVTSTLNFVIDNPETGAKYTVKGHFTFDIRNEELRVDRFRFNCVKDG